MNVPVTAAPAADARAAGDARGWVLAVNCGHCWARPGQGCAAVPPGASHLARWRRAERKGLISREELAAAARAGEDGGRA